MKTIILIFLFLLNANSQQNQNAQKIIERIRENYEKIKDYVVDVKVKIDFEDAVIPEINAKIYFKKPDKFKIDSENFLILPKQSFNFAPDVLFKEGFTSIFSGEQEIDKIKHFIIKIIPEDPENNSVLTLYINSENYTIRKIYALSSNAGKLEAEFMYNLLEGKYWLPSKMIASFETKSFRFPRLRKMDRELKNDSPQKRKGKVTIYYSNYVVNKGLNDRIFEEEKSKSLK